ncbi:YmfQ family protein [Mariprofundus ferrooxydans]|uniref:Tail protein, putative n=1 Tax=Mariprofundus ferrooxydans PV-1 TaxID=314345 RepID=Q0F1S7_9PROT|nr:putative phage tail protein [Mariprofundus ferrooxydans]EAU55823.1 tail protein, putative [Mariprofundus ferrooxydans PV-1]KON47031.1 phage tail protein [Mariprofundus ferrooxydans]
MTTGHAELLKRLLPPVAYDSQAPNISVELQADGKALDAAKGSADAILAEADPRTTYYLLPDWERELGLPDPCVGPLPTIAQRRDAVATKAHMKGGQSIPFFIGLAASLGYTITITEFKHHTVDSDMDTPLYSEEWRFAWQINASLQTIRDMTVDSGVDEPMRSWGNQILECAMGRFRPSHSTLLFSYT